MIRKYLGIALIVLVVLFAMNRITTNQLLKNAKVKAFLLTIRYCEGTLGSEGYRTMFTGKKFSSFSDHPRINNCFGSLCSTAAGAYQFLSRTWDDVRIKLGLLDFGPESQDMAAVYLLKRCGALPFILDGNINKAIEKANGTWASLPGSSYGQPTKGLDQTLAFYDRSYSNFA